MSDYAFVITSNKTYLPGLNIVLNSLDYYGNTADVHIISDGIEDYILEVMDKFNFSITALSISQLPCKHLTFAKYYYMPTLDYKAVCALGADTIVLDNIMKYFEIAEKTDIIPVGRYPHTHITLEHYNYMPAEEVIKMYPLADFPIFVNMEKHNDYLTYCQQIWQKINQDSSISHRELQTINKALYDTGKRGKILVLPGNLWISDALLGSTDLEVWNIGDKKYLYTGLQDRISILHSKAWKEGIIISEIANIKKHYANNPEIISRVINNFEKQKEVLRELSEGHKVKIKVKELQ